MAGAVEDLRALDPALRKLTWKQIAKIAQAPELGKPLGKEMGQDLSSFRAVRFQRQIYRIVYEVLEEEGIVQIWGIGKRERGGIYRAVSRRRISGS